MKHSSAPSVVLGVCIPLLIGTLASGNRLIRQHIFAGPPPAKFVNGDALPSASIFPCLPKDIRGDEVVSYGPKGVQSVTVEKKLIGMKARCRGGKLLDAKGREIRFFRPSCWGNPPPDYLEIRQREDNELVKLKKHYSVIVFGCNPMIQ